MFFAKLNNNLLLSKNQRELAADDLKNFANVYSIYFKFDHDKNELTIIANKKKEINSGSPEIIGFKVDMTGEMTPLFTYRNEEGNYYTLLILLNYINDKEEKMSASELKQIYGDDYEKMKVFSSLSPKERERMSKVRTDFLKLISKLNTSNTYDEVNNFSSYLNGVITPVITFYSYESETTFAFELFLRHGNTSAYFSGKDLSTLLQHYRAGSSFEFRGKKYTLSPSDIEPGYQKAMEILANSYQFEENYYSRPKVSLDLFSFTNLLFSLPGNSVKYDDKQYWVSKDINEGSVALKSDGSLEIYPKKEEFLFNYVSNNRMICFTKETINLYTFESRKIAKVYDFLISSGKDSYKFIKDIFAQKLIPTVGLGILAKPKEGDKDAFEIQLYIDLDDNDSLITKTIYKYGNEELNREHIPSNPYIDTYLGAFSKALSELGIKDNGLEKSQAIVFSFFKADLGPIRKVAKVFLSDRINRMRITSIKGVSISITKERGWLNASMDSKDYSKDELKSILDAYKKKKKFIILRNDMILMDEEVKKVKDVIDELHMNDDLSAEKLPFFEVYNLKAQENENLHLKMNKTLTDSLKEVSNFKDIPVMLDRSIEDKLRPYQKDAVKWMYSLYKNNLDGILADDMGLGKTFETISFISLVSKEMPIIIVCPTSLVYNWANEFKQWNSSQRCITIEGDKKYRAEIIKSINNNEKIVYVTSYDSLRNDLDLYKDKHFALAIIDEAQFIKNAFALKTKAVKKLDSDCRFALTGTPLENRLSDLWSIFDFLMPGYFGSYDKFKEVYENPISADQKGRTKDNLVKRITPFILRRTKKEVLKSLPPKTTTVLSVNMSELERKFYVAYLQKARETLGAEVSKISFLAALTKLREICVDASSFFDGFKEKSSKLDVAERLIEEAIESGHKILIFSSFSTVLHHLQGILKSNEIDSYLIEGATKSGDRVVMAEDFNKTDDIKVMLVSLKAGGTGLNLMGADTVIHLDPWWNFAAEEQATDRAYRIGQLRPVTVYKLVSYDSVEERVIKLQEEKKALYDAVIQNGGNAISSLKDEDIKFILS